MDWSELRNWEEYTKLLIGLFAVTDPLGSLPVLFGLIENHSAQEKKRIALVSATTFVVTLLIFTYVGLYVLEAFGITVAALKIAGGIMFLFYSLEMMGLIRLPSEPSAAKTAGAHMIGIVPIGIPLLAGPGTISTVIIFSGMHESFSHKILVSAVVVIVGIIVFLLYRAAVSMGGKLSGTTTSIMNKIMGLLLAAISIEFILDGIVAHFPGLISIH